MALMECTGLAGGGVAARGSSCGSWCVSASVTLAAASCSSDVVRVGTRSSSSRSGSEGGSSRGVSASRSRAALSVTGCSAAGGSLAGVSSASSARGYDACTPGCSAGGPGGTGRARGAPRWPLGSGALRGPSVAGRSVARCSGCACDARCSGRGTLRGAVGSGGASDDEAFRGEVDSATASACARNGRHHLARAGSTAHSKRPTIGRRPVSSAKDAAFVDTERVDDRLALLVMRET